MSATMSACTPRIGIWAALLVFALLIYPIWGTLAGHAYPALPSFGLPCPTTIFTIGVLALASSPSLRAILTVPILWSLVGSQAVFVVDVKPDLGLTSWCGRPLMLIHSSITQLFNNWSKKAASILDCQQSEGAMPLKFADGV